jgi:glutamate-1-semialdehyde 2,1-aminomutase
VKLDAPAYGRLGALTGRLAAGLRDAAGDRPVEVVSVCGLMTVFFSPEPVRDFAGATSCDLDAYARFCRALLDRGVYAPPSQFEAWFVSLAHDEAAIDRTIAAVKEAFELALA